MKQGLCTHLTRSTREHPDILDRIFVAKKVTIRILGQTVWSNLPLCLTHTHTNYPQTESMWADSMQATWSKSTERQQIVRMFEKGLKEEFKKRESDICPGLKGSLGREKDLCWVTCTCCNALTNTESTLVYKDCKKIQMWRKECGLQKK